MRKTLVLTVCLLGIMAMLASARADFLNGKSRVKVENKVVLKARPFPLENIRLGEGPFKHAMELDKAYLLRLEADRLLSGFRSEAGLEPKAKKYGGWENMSIAGHSLGHYLSAISLMYASTGDTELRKRAEYIVGELGVCQQAQGDGYVAGFPNGKKALLEVSRGDVRSKGFDLNGIWVPWYTQHKLLAGLLDVNRYCGSEKALKIAEDFGVWAYDILKDLSDEKIQTMLNCEHGGMNEVTAELYARTGDKRFLTLTEKFYHKAILDPLSKGEDILPGKHANTQFPKIIGLARRYEITGNKSDGATAEFFWRTVVNNHSYVTGGNSNFEYFGEPKKLNDRLSPNTTESCNVYNMLKLTRHLFAWQESAEYADYYERALYNHILGSQNPETAMMCYFVPLESGTAKTYSNEFDNFSCCHGSGMENHSKYGDSIYFQDDAGLVVNLFIASTLDWQEKGLTVQQETRYPDEATTRLTLSGKNSVRTSVKVRRPFWATDSFTIKVNGEVIPTEAKPGTYATIQREWKDGDTIDIDMPMSLRTETMPDNPKRVALFYGPILLSGDLGLRTGASPRIPVLVTRGREIDEWIKPVAGKALTFRTKSVGKPNDETLIPFFRMHGNRHIVYWDLFSEDEWTTREATYRAEQEKIERLKARTSDILRIGEMQPERDHKVKGEMTSTGEHNGRKFRHASNGGWFSFEMAVAPDTAMELLCTFWGGETGQRTFDVLVDDKIIATQKLEQNKPGEFFEVAYPIPTELTQDKKKVVVKFNAHKDNWAGGLFGCMMLKQEQAEPATPKEGAKTMARDYPISAVPFTDVAIDDPFWSPRMKTNREVTIPYAFQKCEETGRIDNFAIAGGLMKGEFTGIFFNDSDVSKVIEGAAYSLSIHPDAKLEAYVDGVIAKMAAAQEDDGYLYTARTISTPGKMPPGGKERWSDIASGHELYNLGHMYEAGVAYYLATGKRSLLDVSIKSANLVCQVFNANGKRNPPGHQEIEIGLAKLYRVTGDEKYLRQAKFFLDMRGNADGHRLYGEYSQDHKPVTEQTEAVGHAVRATYMYSAMADVAALTGNQDYVTAINRIWENVVSRKMYITGGIGATGGGEAYGKNYELPNRSAYCETCAAIANALWNHRMFLMHGDTKYIDVLERVIYNGFLSGVSMEGNEFFYPNPLESRGGRRSAWFGCSCCPTNVVRFIPSIPGYAYAHHNDALYINLFLGGKGTVEMKRGKVVITQESNYPWDGAIKFTIAPENPGRFTVNIRIPGWVQNEPVPGDLYTYVKQRTDIPPIKINGKNIKYENVKGFAQLTREWKEDDVIELSLPMPVRRIVANEKVEDDRGRVTLQRGPIVFCAEGADNIDGKIFHLMLNDETQINSEYRKDLLNGVMTLKATAVVVKRNEAGDPVAGETQPLVLIPVYAWAHREPGDMEVWLARTVKAAHPLPGPTVANQSKTRVSYGPNPNALSDQLEPKRSGDHTYEFWHCWPHKGTKESVQYDFAKPTKVSKVEVYWFDDTGRGECRPPASWKLLAKVNGEWKEVSNPSAYSVEMDKYVVTTFDAAEAEGLRIEMQCQEKWSTGIHEWRVE